MSKSQEASRNFDKIQSQKETIRYLQEGVRTFASAIIWTKNQDQTITTNLKAFDEKNGFIFVNLPKFFNVDRFQERLSKLGSSECFFSVSLQSANVFFKSPYIETGDHWIKFKIPNDAYKVQRRKNFRFAIPPEYKILLNFPDSTSSTDKSVMIKKYILDVSAGGLAFLVDEEEKEKYSPETIIPEMTFKIRGRSITVNGEIRYLREHPSAKKAVTRYKVGIQFTKINPRDAQEIASYVFDESRKYLTRLL